MREVKQPHGGTLKLAEKGDVLNPKGRTPRLFSQLSAEFKRRGIERATPERVQEVYENLLALTLDEIKKIAGEFEESEPVEIEGEDGETRVITPEQKPDDNDYPVIVRIAAKELTGRRKREVLNDMLDRAHGKAKQSVDMNVQNNTVNDGEFTPAQLDALEKIVGNGSSDVGNKIPAGKPGK